MEHWLNIMFQSSSGSTEQFASFVKDFKKYLFTKKNRLTFHVGHFYISGFYHNMESDQYAYFNIPDVRFFRDEWFNHVLYRTAENDKDYTGGVNRYCRLENLLTNLESLTEVSYVRV